MKTIEDLDVELDLIRVEVRRLLRCATETRAQLTAHNEAFAILTRFRHEIAQLRNELRVAVAQLPKGEPPP